MKRGITIILIFMLTHTIYCQNNTLKTHSLPLLENRTGTYGLKISEYKLKEKSGFPDGFFLQLGGEYGIGILEGGNGKDKGIFWNAFVDFNLFSKTLFLKLEVGQVLSSDRATDGLGYFSIGLNYRIMKNKQHNIYMHFGLGFFRQPMAVILSSKYLFSINKYIGFSVGPRFIYSTWDEHTYLGILAGIQIFTN